MRQSRPEAERRERQDEEVVKPWHYSYGILRRIRLDHHGWDVLTFLTTLPFLYFVFQIWYHSLRPNPDFLSFSANVVQILSIVALLGLQTDWGKRIVQRLRSQIRKIRLFNYRISGFVVMALLTVLTVLIFYLYLPAWARQANLQGTELMAWGQYSQAVAAFRQAISLAPDNANAHYNLGNAYESLNNYEQAIAEYQIALELDDNLAPAYNNVGRLYLHARHDPTAALTTLLTGFDKIQGEVNQAILGKNIGEAYLEKGLLQAALAHLSPAAATFSDVERQQVVAHYQAEIYRLLALTYTRLAQPDAAKQAWDSAKRKALTVMEMCKTGNTELKPYCPYAQIWLAEADENLR